MSGVEQQSTRTEESAPGANTPSASSRGAGPQTPAARWLIETALVILAAFVLAQTIKSFVVQPFVIPTGSMIPTIEIGNRVLAEKVSFRLAREFQQGDIVVFDDPNGQHPELIKRVIAVEGQTVDVRGDLVYVDGRPLEEPYVHGKPTTRGTVPLPAVVPPGQIWLMGDNRPSSGDSRYFGPRPVDTVRGRAFWTYWPLGAFGPLN
ncbi:MAG: signal peptidase I [Actinobacteria bacterium HGW-Actinobacteria-7]|nr:MAG: signal peptidase I [Actinobacteria bacterium HGW-Actinobacteria-7]